jgi:hypothetical protein
MLEISILVRKVFYRVWAEWGFIGFDLVELSTNVLALIWTGSNLNWLYVPSP